MSLVAFGRTVRLITERSTKRSDFRIGLEAIAKETGRLNFDPEVQYDGEGISFRRGDVLFGKLRPNLRKAWLADTEGDAVGDFHVYRPIRELMTSRYLAYLALSEPFLEPVIASVSGAKMPRADWDQLRNIKVWVPELSQQRAIADYLDREAAQIDAFIAKSEQLIALLLERRAAVIELAIGESMGVMAKLSVLLRGLKDGTHGSFVRVESPHPLLGARNIQGGQLVIDEQESSISEADHDSIIANGFPRRGDVLLVIVGATIGKSAIYERAEPLSFQRSVAFLRPGRLLTSKFLWYYSQTRAFQDEVWLRAKVSAQPGLYLGDLASIPIALPNIGAQREITGRLDQAVVLIEKALSVARAAIGLARERRAALISAAVTGKIDLAAHI